MNKNRLSIIIYFFLFIIFLSSVHAYYVTLPAGSIFAEDDGYELYAYGRPIDCQTSGGVNWQYGHNTGFDCLGSGLWDETVSPSYITTSPDNHVMPPLIGELENISQPRITYMVRITGTSLNLHYYNTTLNSMIPKASIDLNTELVDNYDDGTRKVYSEPILYKPHFYNRPLIATLETNASNSYFLHIYEFNETHFFEHCHQQILTSGNGIISARLTYDIIYNLIIVNMFLDTSVRTGFNFIDATSCGTPIYTAFTYYSPIYGSVYSRTAIGNLQLYDSDLNLDNALIETTSATGTHYPKGFNVYQYNETRISQPPGWDDDCSSSFWAVDKCECSNGICKEASLYNDISDPIIVDVDKDGYQEIIYATFQSNTNYELLVIDRNGGLVWSSGTNGHQGGLKQCGDSVYVKNVTFYQPAITSMSSASVPTNELFNVPNAVCGACQTGNGWDDPSVLYVECFDFLNNGESLVHASFDLGENYYRHKSPYAYKPNLPRITSYNIDASTPEPELIIGDMILDYNLNLIKKLDFFSEETVTLLAKIIPFSEYHTNDTQIILWSNQSTRIYKTGKENELPSFVTRQNTVNPHVSDTPICLNFSKDLGIIFQYIINNPEVASDVEYYRYWCNYNNNNEENQTYNNFLNWTAIDEGANNIYTALNCRYNSTGIKRFRIEFSDEWHFNTSVPTFINDQLSIQLIDNNPPLCIDEYGIPEILNPEEIVPETEDELLTIYNLTSGQTVTGGIDSILVEFKIVTTKDKNFMSLLILFVIIIALVMYGATNRSPLGYYLGVGIVIIILFWLFVILGMLSGWLATLLTIIISVLGASVLLKIINLSDKGDG